METTIMGYIIYSKTEHPLTETNVEFLVRVGGSDA